MALVGIRLRGFKGDRECAAAKALAYQSLNWLGSTTQFEITHPPYPGGYGLGLLTVPLILVYLGITLPEDSLW